ncbi:hypothetical protein OXB_0571 [Bacillus sp. OxB-1]|uniref:hypothetical protein n=1 Tax=Bacillus sp. (strain OxB-1) TaxID=98228 RepID=UPI000581E78D|nr:hypothetical protein [Bacillus sp. OxB-1]BAQ09043.1 hypothetical protein OXB_0571 [Bacillus sp. OxB-1]
MDTINRLLIQIDIMLIIILLLVFIVLFKNRSRRFTRFCLGFVSGIIVLITWNLGLVQGTIADELNGSGNILPDVAVMIFGTVNIIVAVSLTTEKRKIPHDPVS